MPPRASLLLNLLLVLAITLSGLLGDAALPIGVSQAMVAGPAVDSGVIAGPLLAGNRAKTRQDRRHDRRKDAEQDRKKDRKQTDRKQDRKKDRKQPQQDSMTDRSEHIQELCTEAGAIWQPESNQCTHGPDPAPPGFAINQPVAPLTTEATEQDLAAAFTCDGNGTTGYRVQVLYVYPRGASRFSQYHQSFLNWTADMDRIFQASAADTNGVRRVRFVHDANCTPTIVPVQVPVTTIGSWDGLISELQRQGFSSLERIYLIFVDTNVFRGVGSWWPDDSPDPNTNPSNIGRSYARVDNGCWSGDVAAHEVMHNLGGVQNSAPHTTFNPLDPIVYSGAHCIDEWDVMCYSDVDWNNDLPPMRYVCGPRALGWTRFDCNHDDYYHTNPAPGSYLATHWNPANNQFLIGANSTSPPPPTPPPPAPTIVSPPTEGSTDTSGQDPPKPKKKHKKRR